MQEKKPNQFDDLDSIEIDLSGVTSTGFSAIDLSGAAGQPVYTLDTMNYDSITYNGASISTISIPSITSGLGGAISGGGGGGGQYTFNVGSGGGGGGLSSGYVYTTNTTGIDWNQPPSVHITQGGIDMPKDSDIKIGDRSLKTFMENVEQRLAILRPNPELEERWEQLKELRNQYETLEKDLLEKEKIMKILKQQ